MVAGCRALLCSILGAGSPQLCLNHQWLQAYVQYVTLVERGMARSALVSCSQMFRGKGTSGHYCQHSVIQWNFIRVTSRHSVTSKKCNCAMRNWSFIRAGLMSITRDCDVSLP